MTCVSAVGGGIRGERSVKTALDFGAIAIGAEQAASASTQSGKRRRIRILLCSTTCGVRASGIGYWAAKSTRALTPLQTACAKLDSAHNPRGSFRTNSIDNR